MTQRKYSFDDVRNVVSESGYTLLSDSSEYQNSQSLIRIECSKHGEQIITFNHFLTRKRCPKCGRESCDKKRMIELPLDEHKQLCDSKGFIYVQSYRKDGRIMIDYICPNHKDFGVQSTRYTNLKKYKQKGCPYCNHQNLPQWYVEKLINENNPGFEMIDPYKNMSTRMNYKCIKHDYIFKTSAKDILDGKGCKYCRLDKLSKNMPIEQYQTKVQKHNPNIIVLEYNGMDCKFAKFKCTKCGCIWESNPQSASQYGKQCPSCGESTSLGEARISKHLDLKGYKYIRQYKFDDCVDKRPLPFDFYLYDHNTCIEFDGMQHYEQRDGWSDIEYVQYHDNIKTKYCKDNKINLIRIPYWEYNNIETILDDKIKTA